MENTNGLELVLETIILTLPLHDWQVLQQPATKGEEQTIPSIGRVSTDIAQIASLCCCFVLRLVLFFSGIVAHSVVQSGLEPTVILLSSSSSEVTGMSHYNSC